MPNTGADPQPLTAVRSLRESLRAEECEVSYWRRLVQGRLDLVRAGLAGKQPRPNDVAVLEGAGGAPARRRSPAALDLLGGRASLLAAVERLWEAPVPWQDPDGLAELERRLVEVEAELSGYRRLLHERIDACTSDLIARYRRDPAQVIDLTGPGSSPPTG